MSNVAFFPKSIGVLSLGFGKAVISSEISYYATTANMVMNTHEELVGPMRMNLVA